ncbi:hypothetical protein [Lysinibacillus sp. Y5S-8]|uniref:hypothetical protein n=1 Tax=Lysinibacillus sp. Y5S-8 TaxID=3122488 RepID=UPI001153DAFB
MNNNIRKYILGFSFISALLLLFSIYPSVNASAAEINVSQNSSQSENISPYAKYSEYVTVYKRYTSPPPSSILHSQKIGSFEYSGYINLFDYVYDPDAGLYFATYKGWIYAD